MKNMIISPLRCLLPNAIYQKVVLLNPILSNTIKVRNCRILALHFHILSIGARCYVSHVQMRNINSRGCGAVGRAVASTLEIHGSNPSIGDEIFRTYVCQLQSSKDENKESEAQWPNSFLKI